MLKGFWKDVEDVILPEATPKDIAVILLLLSTKILYVGSILALYVSLSRYLNSFEKLTIFVALGCLLLNWLFLLEWKKFLERVMK